MKSAIVSDATSLIVLDKLEALSLLCQLFDRVLIPRIVLAEICAGSDDFEERMGLLSCLECIEVPMSSRLSSLLILLDEGEANAIEAAASYQYPLIIDERKGRQIARQMGISIIGFAGLLIQARKQNFLDSESALSLLSQSMDNGLRLSAALHRQVVDTLKKMT